MLTAILGTMKNAILYNIYEFDRSFFIESFCINKNRPELHCDGKCELAKMRKQEDDKKANDMMKDLKSDIVYYFPTHPTVLINNQSDEPVIVKDYPAYCNHMFSYLLISKSVKPPQIA